MPLLRVEAEKLSADQLERGVIEEVIDRDDLLALLPFSPINGKSLVYNREKTIAEGAFLSVYEDIEESASTFDEITAVLKTLAGQVDIDKFLIETMGDTNDQVAIQLAQKAKGMGRQFKRTFFTGDSATNPKEFDGVRKLVTADQTLSMGTNGGALSLSALDELKDSIPNGADAFVFRKGTYRAYKALLRAAGGTTPQMIMIENFGMVPAHDGIPILISDFNPAGEVQGTSTNTASIYAMRLNEVDGIHGIYGGPSAGFRLEDLGTSFTRDTHRWRMKWYLSLVQKSTKSLSRLKGVTNV